MVVNLCKSSYLYLLSVSRARTMPQSLHQHVYDLKIPALACNSPRMLQAAISG